jgi:hypothetical protein
MLEFDAGADLQRFTSIDHQTSSVFTGHRSKAFIENIHHSYLGGLHVGACTAAAAQFGVNDALN